jgi:hypothetical protein
MVRVTHRPGPPPPVTMLAALQATGSCCSLAPMARANLTLLLCYLGIPGVVGIGGCR